MSLPNFKKQLLFIVIWIGRFIFTFLSGLAAIAFGLTIWVIIKNVNWYEWLINLGVPLLITVIITALVVLWVWAEEEYKKA